MSLWVWSNDVMEEVGCVGFIYKSIVFVYFVC